MAISVTFWIVSMKREFYLLKINFLQKGDFSGLIAKNLHANKVIDYLIDKMKLNANKCSDNSDYFVESQEFLA